MGFANESFLQLWPEVIIRHLPRAGSDHVPMALVCAGEDMHSAHKGPRPFRFEPMWLDDENCHEIIKNGWQNPGSRQGVEGILSKIERCASDLRMWEKIHFGSVTKGLKDVMNELEKLAE